MNAANLMMCILAIFVIPQMLNAQSCDTYQTIESQKHCGSEAYLLGFGVKYCARFQDPEYVNRFDDKGKEWLQCVRPCLISAMANFINGNPLATCDAITKFGFHSHPGCFLQCDFCKMCRKNKAALFHALDWGDLLSAEVIEQLYKTTKECPGFGLSCLWGKRNEVMRIAEIRASGDIDVQMKVIT